jgi:hypothetical protein
MTKYSRTISCDNVELKFNVSEISSVPIIRVDEPEEMEEISETLVFN